MFGFENSTTEGRGVEKGGSANSKIKHSEPLTSELISTLYAKVLRSRQYLPTSNTVFLAASCLPVLENNALLGDICDRPYFKTSNKS